MSRIRPHKKSRDGCLGCKRRKIKCDEVHPACTFCSTRRVECVYPTRALRAAKSPIEASPTVSSASSPASCNDSSCELLRMPSPKATRLIPNNGLTMTELKLMHHYAVELSPRLALTHMGVSETVSVWQGEIPRLAFQHEFLMSTVLSISCFYLLQNLDADNVDTKALIRRTNFIEMNALHSYREAIANLTPDNIEAVLAASIIMVVKSIRHFNMHVEGEMWVESFLGLHSGIRTIESVFGQENMSRSPLSPLIDVPYNIMTSGPKYLPPILEELLSPPNSIDLTAEQIQVLDETLDCIRMLYGGLPDLTGSIQLQGKFLLSIVASGKLIPTHFVIMVRQRVPQALVILAHYLLFLKFLGENKNIPNDMTAIVSALDPYWQRYIQTPWRICFMEDRGEAIMQLVSQFIEVTSPMTRTSTCTSTSQSSATSDDIPEEDEAAEKIIYGNMTPETSRSAAL